MANAISSSAFSLELNTLILGDKLVLPELRCTFTYQWDTHNKTGQAQLLGINGSMLAITLYPEEKKGAILFSSDMNPIVYSIQGRTIVIKHIKLLISKGKKYSASIYLNEDGSIVQATENYKKKE